jgi:hypothetical protein
MDCTSDEAAEVASSIVGLDDHGSGRRGRGRAVSRRRGSPRRGDRTHASSVVGSANGSARKGQRVIPLASRNDGPFHGSQDGTSVIEKPPTWRKWRHTPGCASEQSCSNLVLERTDLPTEGRLSHM